MGKEFKEYHSENGRIPYNASQLCLCLTDYAKDYINQKNPAIVNIDERVRDAVIVDSINYLGSRGCLDFALYACDLYDGRISGEEVEASCLLTTVINQYPFYMFEYGIVDSVLRNRHMNNCKERFNEEDGNLVLVDYINFIAKKNDYDRKFTVEELYNKYKTRKYKIEMNELSEFLKSTNTYSLLLSEGKTIDEIFKEMIEWNNVVYNNETGKFYYGNKRTCYFSGSELFMSDLRNIENDVYAMAYAYAKSDSKVEPKTKIINEKLIEMGYHKPNPPVGMASNITQEENYISKDKENIKKFIKTNKFIKPNE